MGDGHIKNTFSILHFSPFSLLYQSRTPLKYNLDSRLRGNDKFSFLKATAPTEAKSYPTPMRRHRFIGHFDLTQPALAINDSEFYNQIKNVLRLAPGEELILADGNENEAHAIISTIEPGVITVKLNRLQHNTNEPTRSVTLYCAILKRENFEWVVQKATEVGVKTIVPITTKRTIKLGLRPDRLEKISKEAAEQSGRGVVPQLHATLTFDQAIAHAQSNAQNYFLDVNGIPSSVIANPFDGIRVNSAKQSQDPDCRVATTPRNDNSVGIFIGPEGGWDPAEIEIARLKNFIITSLGPLTLRAETAATIAAYLAVSL